MGPFSKSLGIFQYSGDLISQDLLPLMLLWNAGNHSIIDLVVLDDLVHGGTSDADSFGNIGDGHPRRLQLSISSESELDDLHFHGKMDTGPFLQELLQILDWQIDN